MTMAMPLRDESSADFRKRQKMLLDWLSMEARPARPWIRLTVVAGLASGLALIGQAASQTGIEKFVG